MTNPNNKPEHPLMTYPSNVADKEKQKVAYATWYASLKPGDVVFYDAGRSYSSYTKKTTVAKRTATGMIRTDDGELFGTDGRHRGGGSYRKLYPYTEELAAFEKRKKLIKELDRIDWKTIDDEGLRKVAAITVEYVLPEYAKRGDEQ